MNEQEYESFVMSLAKKGEDIIERMTTFKANVLHMAVGIAGEAGELLDAIKKYVIYNKPIDRENVIEELGDLEFYMAGLRALVCVTRDEVIAHNVAKLSKRYAEGYSDKAAQERADKRDDALKQGDKVNVCFTDGEKSEQYVGPGVYVRPIDGYHFAGREQHFAIEIPVDGECFFPASCVTKADKA